jgi:hypothetical protein
MKLSKYLLIFLICSIGLSQKYDPKTGELIQEQKYDPKTGELIQEQKYDPKTGELIDENIKLAPSKTLPVINNVNKGPSYLSIITAAKAQAKKKNEAPINVGIGAIGCLFGVIGVPLASLYALADTSGEPNSSYYNELNIENKNIYRSAYKEEMKRLKRTSVFGTMGFGIALFFFLLMSGALF